MPPAADITLYKGPVGGLRHRCPLCPSRSAESSRLLRCTGCRAFRYCGREHQVAHRPQHKSACTKIKNARAKVDREDHKVRNATEDFMTPANAFETHTGHFWGLLNTRDYMRARFGLARKLVLVGTLDGVGEGLEHLRDMLRLCRSDNVGARDIIPAIMLRLDLDQECYDFIKWWSTCDPDGTYDWGDMTLPYLDVHGADVLEDPEFVLGEYTSLNFVVALLILKLKLLVDIRNLKITRKIFAQRRLPLELQDQIERDVIRSPLSVKLQKAPHASLIKTERELLSHASELGETIAAMNTHFVGNLLEPEKALCGTPAAYSRGSWDEMALALQNSYATWWETEGVLDLLDDTRACTSRDLQCDIEHLMMNEKMMGNEPTQSELLADLSLIRIWTYLHYAVENASYLGPWHERPSERYTADNMEALQDY